MSKIKNNETNKLNELLQSLKDIKDIPLLTHDEEIRLGMIIKTSKDQQEINIARNKLINANQGLVVSIAQKHSDNFSLEDLIQEGNLGLLEAAEKYDYEKGFRFSTFAFYYIDGEIKKYIAESSGMSKDTFYNLNNLKIKEAKLTEELKRAPTIEELASELNVSVVVVNNLLEYDVDLINVDALEHKTEVSLFDLFASDIKDPAEHQRIVENEKHLNYVLSKLDDRSRDILMRRYGFYGKIETRNEIAKRHSITAERVRQIEKEAMKKLVKLYHE